MSSQSSGGNAATRVAAFRDRVESLVGRTPWLDHAVRAATRYTEVRGPLLSAGVTYYSFLALFPLVALSYGVVRFLSRFVPDLEQSFNDALDGVLPISVGGSPGVVLSDVSSADYVFLAVALGVLIYAGMKWLRAIRYSLHEIAGLNVGRGQLIAGYVRDFLVLVILGVALIASLGVSSVITQASSWFLGAIHIDGALSRTAGQVIALTLVVLADVLLFAIVLRGLSGAHVSARSVVESAFLAAVGFEALKFAGSWIVARSLNNPVYGVFAVTIGLLVWLNFTSKLLLACAAWMVTAEEIPTDTSEPEDPLSGGREVRTPPAGAPARHARSGQQDAAPDQADTDDGRPAVI